MVSLSKIRTLLCSVVRIYFSVLESSNLKMQGFESGGNMGPGIKGVLGGSNLTTRW